MKENSGVEMVTSARTRMGQLAHKSKGCVGTGISLRIRSDGDLGMVRTHCAFAVCLSRQMAVAAQGVMQRLTL
ncbi:hypothetical protein AN189_12065 [Loktanella sp. 3ANDIMAR09]|nr:hypothetical protein AN189_12065 [Loktanella sp. 3ANDIMAR09]